MSLTIINKICWWLKKNKGGAKRMKRSHPLFVENVNDGSATAVVCLLYNDFNNIVWRERDSCAHLFCLGIALACTMSAPSLPVSRLL